MILGAVAMLVANAAVCLGARVLLRRVATGVGPVDVVLFLVLRLLLVTVTVIVAGVTGTLAALPLAAAGALALAGLVAARAHRGLRPPAWPEIGLAAGVLAALVLARLLAQVWFFAPYPGDVLSYHLPKIAEWVRAGAFTREMGVDTHVTFPAGFELVEAWWTVFLRHDVLIEMAGVEFLVLGAAAVYALTARLGLRSESCFLAGLLYALTPVVHFQATACVNDGPAGALVLATAALVGAPARLALLLLPAGIGIGVKPIYAYALPGLALLWWFGRRVPRAGVSSAWDAKVLASLSLVAGAFWYVRNALWFGNPIHPVGTRGLSGPHPIQFGANPSSLFANIQDLFDYKIYDVSVPYGAFTIDMAGWGAVVFAVGGAALVLFLRADPAFRRLALSMTVSLVAVLTLVKRDPWCLRFVLFFPAVLAISTAWLAERSRAAAFLASAAVIFQVAGTCLPREMPLPLFREFVGQPWRERSMAKTAGVDVPGNRIGYYVDNRNLAYLLYRADFTREVVYLRGKTADELLEELDRRQVATLYASAASLEHAGVLEEARRRGRLRKLGNRIYAYIPLGERLTR